MLTKQEQEEIFKRAQALARLYVARYKYRREQVPLGMPVWNPRTVPDAEEAFKDFLKEVG
ncbi:hypothetical protein [Curvibacter phage PCA1]|nr:hypothetical protein [Curvibacter phage PCA1]